VTRDWAPFVRFDSRTGLGAVGGYAGNGVAAANLAGRTLVELVLRETTERTSFAWVNHTSRNWEPEPLRWLGFNAVLTMGERADAAEQKGRDAGVCGRIFEAFVAH
jgi:hypothetical protein